VLRQIRTDTLFLVHLDDQQRDCGDEGGESEEQQLGVAPIGQCRCHRHHGLWLGGHAAVRQLVPGSGCVVGGLGVAEVGGGAVAGADGTGVHAGGNAEREAGGGGGGASDGGRPGGRAGGNRGGHRGRRLLWSRRRAHRQQRLLNQLTNLADGV